MNEEWVKKAINEYSKEINGRIIIVDKNNIVKGDSNNLFIGDTFKHDEIQKALNGENSRRVYNFRDTGRVMYVSVPVILNDEIVGATLISVSIDNIYLEVKHISRKVALISGISMLVTAIIAFFFSDAIFKPLGQLKNAINKVAQGHLEEKVNIDSNDEFKEVAEAFNIMILKLDQVDTQRKDFVANVSHELRTPLTSIKILSESLISGEDFNVDVYKEFLTDIDSEVDRLNNIITDLLTLVDLDKEKLTLDLKITYMNFLLERIYLRLKPLAEKKSIDLELVLNEKIQLKVDNEKIQQAIINIIDNAIKYTQTGGKVKLKLYNEGKYAIIEIKDNGIGIPEENIQNIFERFYRVDKARSRDLGGTGLGLSIAKQIIEAHNGRIVLSSEYNMGTEVDIVLPIGTRV